MPAALVVWTAGGGDLTWVLLAANGRPLARSTTVFRTDEDLSAAWRELVADRDALSIRVGRDSGGTDWWWTATLPPRISGGAAGGLGGLGAGAGITVARSARGYQRSDQCRGGAAGFLRVLPEFARRPR